MSDFPPLVRVKRTS